MKVYKFFSTRTLRKLSRVRIFVHIKNDLEEPRVQQKCPELKGELYLKNVSFLLYKDEVALL